MELLSEEEIINNSREYKDICGVYFLIQDNKIVYIGKSFNIYVRIDQHYKSEKIIFDKWNYIELSKEKIDEMETRYVLKYNPKYNKILPTKSSDLKTIKQLKNKLNLPIPIIEKWIEYKNPIAQIYENKKGNIIYYHLFSFDELYKFKNWMKERYPYKKIDQCSIKYLNKYMYNILGILI